MNEKTLLSFFWDLASTNETTRVDTAINLINHLQSCDKAFEKNEVCDPFPYGDYLGFLFTNDQI